MNSRDWVIAALVMFWSIFSLGQNHSAWQEYSYPQEGFAITFPTHPSSHDSTMSNMTAYTVNLTVDAGLSLRVDHAKRDCTSTLSLLKSGAMHGKQPEEPIDPASVKEFSLNGYPGLEYEFEASPFHRTYDRYYCVDGTFYLFTAAWTGKDSMPPDMKRIIDSFRLLKSSARN